MQWLFELFQYSENSLFSASVYNPWFVILSVSIAIFASFMGFQVAGQAATTTGFRKHFFLSVGSIALGGGVWSMHFIGMLALQICTSVGYNLITTVLSVIPAIVASWVALNLITKGSLKPTLLIVGGVLVGSGIGTMHYLGMAAMEMAVSLRYNLPMFLVSILVAVALAVVSLWVRFGLDQLGTLRLSTRLKILISSGVMGAAISGMHYTGMAAARFVLPPGMDPAVQQTGEISLALASIITAITVLIIILVLAANLIFSYRDKSAIALRNEKRLIATMDTARDGIITIDDQTNIISINKAVSDILGWREADLLDQPVKVLGIEESHLNIDSQHLDSLSECADTLVKSQDGQKIPVRLNLGRVNYDSLDLSVIFLTDLREHKRLEAEIKRNESQIRAILGNIPGITYRCIHSPGWPNIFINDQVERIIGYPKEDFLLPNPRRSIADFIHPDDIDIVEQTDLLNPEGYQLEFRIIDRFGSLKWMLGYGKAIEVESINEVCLDGFIMDISDRKTMETDLIAAKVTAEKAAESRASFLANMSHEIRTPMNAVIGFSELLLQDKLTDSQSKQLKTINQSAKSLLHILNDILDSAKLDKGKFELEYRDFSLVEEIDSVVSTLWIQAQKKGLSINLSIDTELQTSFNGAPDRIRQVLTNLIGNAIKFTEQGEVSVQVTTTNMGCVQFTISDTGIGMNSTQLESIFDAFSQADESMSRRFGGTGLGTTISKQLVELMGGKIIAESELGVGSSFIFTLPLKPAAMVTSQPKVAQAYQLPELSILIVDDIEQNLDLLMLLLQKDGHTIYRAKNGEEALMVLSNTQIDVAIMDVQMPVMDGLTAAKKRRQFEQENGLIRTPIIALTASVLAQDRLSAEEAGMDGFANKPIDYPQLVGEISRVLFKGQHKCHSSGDSVMQSQVQIADSVIDIERGASLWGSKTSLYNEVTRYVNQLGSEIDTYSNALSGKDYKFLATSAHKNKGSAGNLAIVKLAKAFGKLEVSIEDEDTKTIMDVIEEIQNEFSLLKTFLRDRKGLEVTESSEMSTPVSSDETHSLIEILNQLNKLTEGNEINDELLDQLAALKFINPILIAEIIEQCHNFEFEAALKKIVELQHFLTTEF